MSNICGLSAERLVGFINDKSTDFTTLDSMAVVLSEAIFSGIHEDVEKFNMIDMIQNGDAGLAEFIEDIVYDIQEGFDSSADLYGELHRKSAEDITDTVLLSLDSKAKYEESRLFINTEIPEARRILLTTKNLFNDPTQVASSNGSINDINPFDPQLDSMRESVLWMSIYENSFKSTPSIDPYDYIEAMSSKPYFGSITVPEINEIATTYFKGQEERVKSGLRPYAIGVIYNAVIPTSKRNSGLQLDPSQAILDIKAKFKQDAEALQIDVAQVAMILDRIAEGIATDAEFAAYYAFVASREFDSIMREFGTIFIKTKNGYKYDMRKYRAQQTFSTQEGTEKAIQSSDNLLGFIYSTPVVVSTPNGMYRVNDFMRESDILILNDEITRRKEELSTTVASDIFEAYKGKENASPTATYPQRLMHSLYLRMFSNRKHTIIDMQNNIVEHNSFRAMSGVENLTHRIWSQLSSTQPNDMYSIVYNKSVIKLGRKALFNRAPMVDHASSLFTVGKNDNIVYKLTQKDLSVVSVDGGFIVNAMYKGHTYSFEFEGEYNHTLTGIKPTAETLNMLRTHFNDNNFDLLKLFKVPGYMADRSVVTEYRKRFPYVERSVATTRMDDSVNSLEYIVANMAFILALNMDANLSVLDEVSPGTVSQESRDKSGHSLGEDSAIYIDFSPLKVLYKQRNNWDAVAESINGFLSPAIIYNVGQDIEQSHNPMDTVHKARYNFIKFKKEGKSAGIDVDGFELAGIVWKGGYAGYGVSKSTKNLSPGESFHVTMNGLFLGMLFDSRMESAGFLTGSYPDRGKIPFSQINALGRENKFLHKRYSRGKNKKAHPIEIKAIKYHAQYYQKRQEEVVAAWKKALLEINSDGEIFIDLVDIDNITSLSDIDNIIINKYNLKLKDVSPYLVVETHYQAASKGANPSVRIKPELRYYVESVYNSTTNGLKFLRKMEKSFMNHALSKSGFNFRITSENMAELNDIYTGNSRSITKDVLFSYFWQAQIYMPMVQRSTIGDITQFKGSVSTSNLFNNSYLIKEGSSPAESRAMLENTLIQEGLGNVFIDMGKRGGSAMTGYISPSLVSPTTVGSILRSDANSQNIDRVKDENWYWKEGGGYKMTFEEASAVVRSGGANSSLEVDPSDGEQWVYPLHVLQKHATVIDTFDNEDNHADKSMSHSNTGEAITMSKMSMQSKFTNENLRQNGKLRSLFRAMGTAITFRSADNTEGIKMQLPAIIWDAKKKSYVIDYFSPRRTMVIHNYNELFEALGGVNSDHLEIVDGKSRDAWGIIHDQILSGNNSRFFPDHTPADRDKIIAGMTNKYVHIISTPSSEKTGATNINTRETWDNLENDPDVKYHRISFENYGVIYNAGHDSDASDGTDLESHINMVTQVIQTSGVGSRNQSLSQSIREAVKVLSDMGVKEAIDDKVFNNLFGVAISMANGFGSSLKHGMSQLLTQAEANTINGIIRNPSGTSKGSLTELHSIITSVNSRTDGKLLMEAKKLFNRQAVTEALRLSKSAAKVSEGYEEGDLDANSKQINKILTSTIYSLVSKNSVRHHFKGNYLVLGSSEDVVMLYPVDINGKIKWLPWEDFQKSKHVPFKEVTGVSDAILGIVGGLSSSDIVKVVYDGKTTEQPIHLFRKDFQETNPLHDLTQLILNGAEVHIKGYDHLTDSNGEVLKPRNLEYLHHKRRIIKEGKVIITDSAIFDSDAYKGLDAIRNSAIKEYNPVGVYHSISDGITGLNSFVKGKHGMITDGTVFRVRNEDRSYTMYKWNITEENPMTGAMDGIYEEYADYYTESRYTEDEFNIYLAYNENANISYEQYYDSTDIRMDINADIHESLVRYEKLSIKELLEDTLDYIMLEDGAIVDDVLPTNRFIDEQDFAAHRAVGKFLVTVNGVTMWNNEGVLIPISPTDFTEIPFEKGVTIKVKAVSESAWHTRPTELIAPPNYIKTFYMRDGSEGTEQDSLEDFFGGVDYSELSEYETEDIYNKAIREDNFDEYSATPEARHLKGIFQKRIFQEFDKASSSHVAIRILLGSPILGDTASLDIDNYDFEKEIENGRLKSKAIVRKRPAALISILKNDLKFVAGLSERYPEFKVIADQRIDAILDAIAALEVLSDERGINDDMKISIINNYNSKLAEFQDTFIEDTSAKLALSFRASLQMFFARVPTQGGQSYSWGQLAGFRFSTANTVYTSAELVAISGADFDIDKLFIMKYNIDGVGQLMTLESTRVFKGTTYTFKSTDADGKVLIDEHSIEKYIQARVTDFETKNTGKEGPMSDMRAKRQSNHDALVNQFKAPASKFKDSYEFLGKTYEFTAISPKGRRVKNHEVINQYIADAMAEFDRQMYDKDSKMVIDALKESAAFKKTLRAEYIAKVQNVVTNSLIINSGDPRNYIQATTPVVMDILERAEAKQRKLNSRKLQLNAGEGSSDPNADVFDYDSKSMFLENITSAHDLEGEGSVGKSMIGLVATAMKLYGMIHASSVQQGEDAKIPYSFIQNYPESIGDKMMQNMESVVVNFSENIAKYPTIFIPYGDNQVKAITAQGVADIRNTTKRFSREHYIRLKILRGRIKRLASADDTGEIQATAVFKALGDDANISALSTKVEAWELFTELLSASVDNAKHLILAKLGMDPIAAPIVNSMVIMGFNLDQIMLFLNRPHIKKILDVTRESVDSTSSIPKTSLRGAMFKAIFNTANITAKVNMGRIVSNTPKFFRGRRGSKVNFLETGDSEVIHNDLVKELTGDFMFLQSVLDFEKDLKLLLMPGGTNQGLKVKSFDAFRVTTLFEENINMRIGGVDIDGDDMHAYRKLTKEEVELNRLEQLKSMDHVFNLGRFVADGSEGDAYRAEMIEMYDKVLYSHLNVLQVLIDNPNLYAYVKRQVQAKELLTASESVTKRVDDVYKYLNKSGKLTPFMDSGAFVNLENIVDEIIVVGYFNKYQGIYKNFKYTHDSSVVVDLTTMEGREEFLEHIGDFKSYLDGEYPDNAFVRLLREHVPSSASINSTEVSKIHLLSTEDLRHLSDIDYSIIVAAFNKLKSTDKEMFNLYSLLINKGGRPSRSFDHLLDFADIVEFTEFKTESLNKDENFKKLLTGPSVISLFLNHQQLLRSVFTEKRLSKTDKQEAIQARMEAERYSPAFKTDLDYLNFPKVTDALFKLDPMSVVKSNELNRVYVTLLEFRDRLSKTNGWFPIQRVGTSHTIQYEMDSNPKLRGLNILFDAGHSPLRLKFKIKGEERRGYILGLDGFTEKYILIEETIVNGVTTLKEVTQDVSDNNAGALSDLNDHLEIKGGLIKLTNKKKKAITREEAKEDIERANANAMIRMFKNNSELANSAFAGNMTLKALTGEVIKNVKPGTTVYTHTGSKGKIRVVYQGMRQANEIRGIVSAADLKKLQKGKVQVVKFHVTSSEFSANISQANLGVKQDPSTLSLFNNQKKILAKQGYVTVMTPVDSKERIIAGRSISDVPTRITLERDLKKVFNLTNKEAEAMSVMWDNAFSWIANRRGITKPEAYSRFLESVKADRSKDVTEKGRTELRGDMHTVYGMLNADKSTAVHELAHVFQHFLTAEERIIVEKWAVGTDKWNKDIKWTDDNNYIAEKFAKGFEEYLRKPPKTKKGISRLFELFAEMLSSVYNGIVKYNKEKIKLSPEMEGIYKQIVANDKNVSMPTDKVMLKYAFMDIYNLTPEQAAATANMWDKTMEWIANKTGISKERAYRTSIAKIEGNERDPGVSVVSNSTFQALINVSPFGNIENPISDLVQLFEIHMSEEERKVFDQWAKKEGVVDPLEKSEKFKEAFVSYIVGGTGPAKFKGIFKEFATWLEAINSGLLEFNGKSTKLNGLFRGILTSSAPATESDVYAETDEDLPGSARILKVEGRNYKQIYRGIFKNVEEYRKYLDGVNMPYNGTAADHLRRLISKPTDAQEMFLNGADIDTKIYSIVPLNQIHRNFHTKYSEVSDPEGATLNSGFTVYHTLDTDEAVRNLTEVLSSVEGKRPKSLSPEEDERVDEFVDEAIGKIKERNKFGEFQDTDVIDRPELIEKVGKILTAFEMKSTTTIIAVDKVQNTEFNIPPSLKDDPKTLAVFQFLYRKKYKVHFIKNLSVYSQGGNILPDKLEVRHISESMAEKLREAYDSLENPRRDILANDTGDITSDVLLYAAKLIAEDQGEILTLWSYANGGFMKYDPSTGEFMLIPEGIPTIEGDLAFIGGSLNMGDNDIVGIEGLIYNKAKLDSYSDSETEQESRRNTSRLIDVSLPITTEINKIVYSNDSEEEGTINMSFHEQLNRLPETSGYETYTAYTDRDADRESGESRQYVDLVAERNEDGTEKRTRKVNAETSFSTVNEIEATLTEVKTLADGTIIMHVVLNEDGTEVEYDRFYVHFPNDNVRKEKYGNFSGEHRIKTLKGALLVDGKPMYFSLDNVYATYPDQFYRRDKGVEARLEVQQRNQEKQEYYRDRVKPFYNGLLEVSDQVAFVIKSKGDPKKFYEYLKIGDIGDMLDVYPEFIADSNYLSFIENYKEYSNLQNDLNTFIKDRRKEITDEHVIKVRSTTADPLFGNNFTMTAADKIVLFGATHGGTYMTEQAVSKGILNTSTARAGIQEGEQGVILKLLKTNKKGYSYLKSEYDRVGYLMDEIGKIEVHTAGNAYVVFPNDLTQPIGNNTSITYNDLAKLIARAYNRLGYTPKNLIFSESLARVIEEEAKSGDITRYNLRKVVGVEGNRSALDTAPMHSFAPTVLSYSDNLTVLDEFNIRRGRDMRSTNMTDSITPESPYYNSGYTTVDVLKDVYKEFFLRNQGEYIKAINIVKYKNILYYNKNDELIKTALAHALNELSMDPSNMMLQKEDIVVTDVAYSSVTTKLIPRNELKHYANQLNYKFRVDINDALYVGHVVNVKSTETSIGVESYDAVTIDSLDLTEDEKEVLRYNPDDFIVVEFYRDSMSGESIVYDKDPMPLSKRAGDELVRQDIEVDETTKEVLNYGDWHMIFDISVLPSESDVEYKGEDRLINMKQAIGNSIYMNSLDSGTIVSMVGTNLGFTGFYSKNDDYLGYSPENSKHYFELYIKPKLDELIINNGVNVAVSDRPGVEQDIRSYLLSKGYKANGPYLLVRGEVDRGFDSDVTAYVDVVSNSTSFLNINNGEIREAQDKTALINAPMVVINADDVLQKRQATGNRAIAGTINQFKFHYNKDGEVSLLDKVDIGHIAEYENQVHAKGVDVALDRNNEYIKVLLAMSVANNSKIFTDPEQYIQSVLEDKKLVEQYTSLLEKFFTSEGELKSIITSENVPASKLVQYAVAKNRHAAAMYIREGLQSDDLLHTSSDIYENIQEYYGDVDRINYSVEKDALRSRYISKAEWDAIKNDDSATYFDWMLYDITTATNKSFSRKGVPSQVPFYGKLRSEGITHMVGVKLNDNGDKVKVIYVINTGNLVPVDGRFMTKRDFFLSREYITGVGSKAILKGYSSGSIYSYLSNTSDKSHVEFLDTIVKFADVDGMYGTIEYNVESKEGKEQLSKAVRYDIIRRLLKELNVDTTNISSEDMAPILEGQYGVMSLVNTFLKSNSAKLGGPILPALFKSRRYGMENVPDKASDIVYGRMYSILGKLNGFLVNIPEVVDGITEFNPFVITSSGDVYSFDSEKSGDYRYDMDWDKSGKLRSSITDKGEASPAAYSGTVFSKININGDLVNRRMVIKRGLMVAENFAQDVSTGEFYEYDHSENHWTELREDRINSDVLFIRNLPPTKLSNYVIVGSQKFTVSGIKVVGNTVLTDNGIKFIYNPHTKSYTYELEGTKQTFIKRQATESSFHKKAFNVVLNETNYKSKQVDKKTMSRVLTNMSAHFGVDFQSYTSEEITTKFGAEYNSAFGFIYGGELIINADIATLDTPLHEFGHIFFRHLRNTQPEVFASLAKKALADPLAATILESYPELESDVDGLAEEVLTSLLGLTTQDNVLEVMGEEHGIIKRFIDFLREGFNFVFGIKNKPYEINTEKSLHEVLNEIGTQLLYSPRSILHDYIAEEKGFLNNLMKRSLTAAQMITLLKKRNYIVEIC